MKDIYKNPIFYYILVPALAALWPAIIWGVYLPASRANLSEEMDQFTKAEQLIEELLAADPERLNFTKEKDAASGFDYATAVQQAAEFCSVPAGNYKLSSGIITKSEGQKSQPANVSLKGVEITKAARFLSTIQLRWSGLQCTKMASKRTRACPMPGTLTLRSSITIDATLPGSTLGVGCRTFNVQHLTFFPYKKQPGPAFSSRPRFNTTL